jgi:hypothetical protein
MGVRVVRDDAVEDHLANFMLIARETGVKYVLTQSGARDPVIPRLVRMNRTLARQGALLAIEGLNEPNNWPVQEVHGFASRAHANNGANVNIIETALAMWTRDFYIAIKSVPELREFPIFHASDAGGSQFTNIGMQLLTIPEGTPGVLLPEGTQLADVANVHNYISAGGNHVDNKQWNFAGIGPGTGNGIWGNYGITWNRSFRGYGIEDLWTLPRVTTETGWATNEPGRPPLGTPNSGITRQQQADILIQVYLSQFARGFDHTFIYLLLDRGTGPGGDNGFGMFDRFGNPKLSATYIRNLMSILDNERGTYVETLGRLDYTIDNRPATVQDMLLQKSCGTLYLIIWNERLNPSWLESDRTDTLEISFGRAFERINIYNPATGDEPVDVLENADLFLTEMKNEVLIFEFK